MFDFCFGLVLFVLLGAFGWGWVLGFVSSFFFHFHFENSLNSFFSLNYLLCVSFIAVAKGTG